MSARSGFSLVTAYVLLLGLRGWPDRGLIPRVAPAAPTRWPSSARKQHLGSDPPNRQPAQEISIPSLQPWGSRSLGWGFGRQPGLIPVGEVPRRSEDEVSITPPCLTPIAHSYLWAGWGTRSTVPVWMRYSCGPPQMLRNHRGCADGDSTWRKLDMNFRVVVSLGASLSCSILMRRVWHLIANCMFHRQGAPHRASLGSVLRAMRWRIGI